MRPVTLEGHKEETKNAGHPYVSDLRRGRFASPQKTRLHMDRAASFRVTCGGSQRAARPGVPIVAWGSFGEMTRHSPENRVDFFRVAFHFSAESTLREVGGLIIFKTLRADEF